MIARGNSRRRLETALLSCSRQSLPRPARLYSTPTKRVNGPALATETPSPPHGYPTFMPHKANIDIQPLSEDVQSFLRRRVPYTLLPTPLPEDRSSPLNDFYFTDSPTQDLLAVIDACLHNAYDVPRAKHIFDQLRETRAGDPILSSQVYNSFLGAYLAMATEKDIKNRDTWVEDTWSLFEHIESEKEKVPPSAGTYAIMLLCWFRFNPDSANPVLNVNERTPANLLRCILDRQISLPSVVSDKVFSPEEASKIINHLSRAAVGMGLSKIITELGQIESAGADPLENTLLIKPVTRLKVKPSETKGSNTEDGFATEVTEENQEPEYEVPFNLDNLRKHLAEVAFARRVLPDDAASRQKLLEASVYDVAVQRLRHEAEKLESLGLGDKGLNQPQLQKWMFAWHKKLKARLEVEIAAVIEEESLLPADATKRNRLGPFLSLLKPEKLSLITILELMRLQGSGGIAEGMKTARALLTVGKAVEMEYQAETLKKHHMQVPTVPARFGESTFFSKKAYSDLRNWRLTAKNYEEDSVDWTSEWTQVVRARVGSFLVDCLMDVATVTRTAVDKHTGETLEEDQPAFFHSYEYLRGHKLGVIRLNPEVADRLARDGLRETLHPRHLPMLVQPKPWLSHDNGGYLYNKTSAMRFKDTQEQLTYLRHASSLGHVELVYAGLDVLGSTPWKINKAIFAVVLDVWNAGARFGKISPSIYDQPEPVRPDDYEMNMAAKTLYLAKLREYQRGKANAHSDRCSVNYKIEIARAFINDTFYLPHNLDFRGRAYPIPPHLSQVSDDLSRGLLTFAEARPLGESGLRWLKIHLANLFGFDKGSLEERVKFVEEHMEDIYDSAERPLEGRQWWRKGDDPWQTLATCMELCNALESSDPHAFESCLPVHQDGTCNGLQHYAALGGDDRGAAQVNLSVTDRPSDVYSHVAAMVEKVIAEDAAKGHKYAQMLTGKVSRKVVKQTVMTTVYGVTFIGARSQIEKQLKDRGDIPVDDCWLAASYLAKNTLAAIGDLFTGAKGIQQWLTLSARLIAKAIPESRVIEAISELEGKNKNRGQPVQTVAQRLPKEQMTSVVWTTPLGLPIVQPYRKTKRKQIMTALQTVYISDPNSPSEVNATKQSSAFPPNFIHSLDATHMMLTALECRTNGLTFASVHDSYWTHAATIDKMSEIIRDTFIALHESDILGKLHAEFMDRYKDYKVPVVALKSPKLAKLLKLPQAAVGLVVETPEEVAQLENELQGQELPLEMELSMKGEEAVVQDAGTDVEVLVDMSSDNSTESSFAAVQQDLVSPKRKRGRPKKAVGPKPEPVNQAPALMPTPESPEEESRTAILSKFVDLTALLPPLPQKGTFDVKTIKQSQYFFS